LSGGGEIRQPDNRHVIRREAPGWGVERLEIFIKLIGPVEAEERKLIEVI
jgi:hypothetical protein